VDQITAQPGESADTPAPAGHVFNLGFEAGQHDAAERARLAALALTSTQPDEDGEAETRIDWSAFPIGLTLHRAVDALSVGLWTEGTDSRDLLHPDEADQLAAVLTAYANAARSAA
jgi:hypothetical protein